VFTGLRDEFRAARLTLQERTLFSGDQLVDGIGHRTLEHRG
jgi:hypothetical protein